mmetsp:Transcript_26947/g.82715  ORF Transcript_26947/g.82715 Transcript_26947/m.82715 type:complete len:496 (-) Transcript_26947:2639-4126(-)
MGFPASDFEGAYRNNIDEVEEFFDSRHAQSYRFYNLCAERTYPSTRFHGRFARFPFADHNPPPLGLFSFFCRDVDEFLGEHPDNVVAVHCKAGKGRTGVMISAYLMWKRDWSTPSEAMQFYGHARTKNLKGVTIPSQRRFVEYFARTLAEDDDARAGAVVPSSEASSEASVVVSSTPPPPHRRAHHRSRRRHSAPAELTSGGGTTALSEDGSDEEEHKDEYGDGTLLQDSTEESSCGSDDDDLSDAETTVVLAADATPPRPSDERPKRDDAGNKTPSSSSLATCPSPVPSSPVPPNASAALGYDTLDRTFASYPELWPSGSPAAKRVAKRLNDGWNRKNRLQLSGRGALPPPALVFLRELRVHRATFSRFGHEYEPVFKVTCGDFEWDSARVLPSKPRFKLQPEIVLPLPNLPLTDEVLVVFYARGVATKTKSFCFWFHCSFLTDDRLYLRKHELDKACKDKKAAKFDDAFAVELRFRRAPPPVNGGPPTPPPPS